MKTEQLIDLLAQGETAVTSNLVAQRYGLALGWGAFGCTLLMALLLGVRSDLAEAIRLPMFWVKLAFPAGLIAAALVMAARLSRPGARLGLAPLALATPVLAMWSWAAVVLIGAPSAERAGLVMGISASSCPIVIAWLSMPLFVAVFWAFRGLAPTRPAMAGAIAGLIAGSGSALVYSLYCIEMDAPFIAVWYLLGMLIPAALGAVVGSRLLRW